MIQRSRQPNIAYDLTRPDPIALEAERHRRAIRRMCEIIREEHDSPAWSAPLTPLPLPPRRRHELTSDRVGLVFAILIALAMVWVPR